MLFCMDRRIPSLTPRSSTDPIRPSAGGGTAANVVEMPLPSLRVVPDIAVPSATGGHPAREVDHAGIAAVLRARCSHMDATSVSHHQEGITR